jgi:hypothetical protein
MSDNRLPPMGWPWDALADAVLRWAEADRRHHAAAVAGDVSARERAALDRDIALTDRAELRQEMARQWLAGLRAAVEVYGPATIAELLGGLPPAETVVEAIGELEDRVDAAEDAVVKLMLRRAV